MARPSTIDRSTLLAAASGVAAIGFVVLARAVGRRKTQPTDRAMQRETTPSPGHPSRQIARALGPVGKWYTYVPAALALSAHLRHQRRDATHHAAGRAIVRAAFWSFALTRLFDHVLPQPPAPAGHRDPHKPVFPSGHAFGTLAVGLTAAYTMSRVGAVPTGRAYLAALAIPVVAAGGRFIEERHWPSDILGGTLGGLAVAAWCASQFESRIA